MKPLKITTKELEKLHVEFDMASRRLDNDIRIGSRYIDQSRDALKSIADKLEPVESKFGDPVEAYLAKINGRAAVHVISTYGEILNLARDAEEALEDKGVPIKHRIGTLLTFVDTGPGKAYARKGHKVLVSSLTLKRTAGGWSLVEYDKVGVWADSKESKSLHVRQEAEKSIIDHAMSGIFVLGVAS